MIQFRGEVVVVTGATSGIGRATARLFGQRGATVVVAGRDAGRGAETVDLLHQDGAEATFVAADVTRADDVRALMAHAAGLRGRIHYLVNNAGVEPSYASIADTPDEEVDRVIDTDLKGSWRCIKAALPLLAAPGGAIVNVASFAGVTGWPQQAHYSAAKGGVIALTRSVAVDVAARGIRVNTVSPGAIDTPMLQRATGAQGDGPDAWAGRNVPLGRVGRAEEIAAAIVWLCSGEASYMTGEHLVVDGGYAMR